VSKPIEPIRLVAFDVDGTLVDGVSFIWQLLHETLQTDEPARKWAYDAFFAGEISYEEWAKHDVHLLRQRDATREKIQEALDQTRPMEGAEEVLRTLGQHDICLAVLSGSVDLTLEYAFPDYRSIFDHVLINHFLFDGEGRLADIEPTPFDFLHKATGLRHIADSEGIPLTACAFVGDHINDVGVARTAGLSIAFNCKAEELAEASDVVVEGKDLRLVLPHLLRGR
jgi:phosphoserine phosphatase